MKNKEIILNIDDVDKGFYKIVFKELTNIKY